MKRNVYHGILIDLSFADGFFPKEIKIINKKISGEWIIYGVEIEKEKFAVANIQEHMVNDDKWYCHFYDDEELIVIFKNKYYIMDTNELSWNPAVHYGKQVGILEEQLDFWPNRFQDERHYFNS